MTLDIMLFVATKLNMPSVHYADCHYTIFHEVPGCLVTGYENIFKKVIESLGWKERKMKKERLKKRRQ